MPINLVSQSPIISSGNPKYFTTFQKKSLSAYSIIHGCGAIIKTAYFENLSTTTNIELNPLTLGKPQIKSMEIGTHGLLTTCNDCKSLASFYLSSLLS